jgi:hypothetical protein
MGGGFKGFIGNQFAGFSYVEEPVAIGPVCVVDFGLAWAQVAQQDLTNSNFAALLSCVTYFSDFEKLF